MLSFPSLSQSVTTYGSYIYLGYHNLVVMLTEAAMMPRLTEVFAK